MLKVPTLGAVSGDSDFIHEVDLNSGTDITDSLCNLSCSSSVMYVAVIINLYKQDT